MQVSFFLLLTFEVPFRLFTPYEVCQCRRQGCKAEFVTANYTGSFWMSGWGILRRDGEIDESHIGYYLICLARPCAKAKPPIASLNGIREFKVDILPPCIYQE